MCKIDFAPTVSNTVRVINIFQYSLRNCLLLIMLRFGGKTIIDYNITKSKFIFCYLI